MHVRVQVALGFVQARAAGEHELAPRLISARLALAQLARRALERRQLVHAVVDDGARLQLLQQRQRHRRVEPGDGRRRCPRPRTSAPSSGSRTASWSSWKPGASTGVCGTQHLDARRTATRARARPGPRSASAPRRRRPASAAPAATAGAAGAGRRNSSAGARRRRDAAWCRVSGCRSGCRSAGRRGMKERLAARRSRQTVCRGSARGAGSGKVCACQRQALRRRRDPSRFRGCRRGFYRRSRRRSRGCAFSCCSAVAHRRRAVSATGRAPIRRPTWPGSPMPSPGSRRSASAAPTSPTRRSAATTCR